MGLRFLDPLAPGHGRLLLASMPGRFEPWSEFALDARRAGVGLVVCLAPMDEVVELSPIYAKLIGLGELPFRWLHLPMRNYGLPEDQAGFRAGIARIDASLRGGENVVLHCAAGIGRTGSAAACVLKCAGLPTLEALARVRAAGSNPENAVQSGLVEQFA